MTLLLEDLQWIPGYQIAWVSYIINNAEYWYVLWCILRQESGEKLTAVPQTQSWNRKCSMPGSSLSSHAVGALLTPQSLSPARYAKKCLRCAVQEPDLRNVKAEPNDCSAKGKLKGDWMPFPARCKQTDVTVVLCGVSASFMCWCCYYHTFWLVRSSLRTLILCYWTIFSFFF